YRVGMDDACTGNVSKLLSSPHPFTKIICLLALAFAISVNSVALFQGVRAGPKWLLLLVIISPIWSFAGYELLKVGLNQEVPKYGRVFSAQQFLLSPDRQNYLTDDAIRYRWVMLHCAGILAIAALQLPEVFANDITGSRRRTDPLGETAGRNIVAGHSGYFSDLLLLTRKNYALLALVYSLLAVYGSLVPFEFRSIGFDEAVGRFSQIRYLNLGVASRADVVANVLLFIPLAFLWMGTFTVDSVSPRRTTAAAAIVVLFSVAASAAIEFTQIWFPRRTVSLNDIIAESFGAVSGTAIWMIFGETLTREVRRFVRASVAGDQVRWLLQAYVAGLCIYSLLPLDLTISPNELYDKYREGKILLTPFSHSSPSGFELNYEIVSDVAVFVPVGMLIAAYHCNSSRLVSLIRCAAAGMCGVVVLELMQIFVYSRFVDVTDVITGTIGVTMGAGLLVARQRQSVRANATVTEGSASYWWLLLFSGYAACLCIGFWMPFDFEFSPEISQQRLNGFFRIPFSALYFGNDYNVMVQLVRKTVLFMPLGALAVLVVGVRRRPEDGGQVLRISLMTLMSCGIASAIEFGQVFLPGKVADFTDVLVCCMGVISGVWIAIRLRFAAGLPLPLRFRSPTQKAVCHNSEDSASGGYPNEIYDRVWRKSEMSAPERRQQN
ncbi:MAG: VanZ family protein, partial [Planctomycetaceae bacterium]|nr:VanZ family protein [Planctomycetaceae bacterium]